jgi:hypothetical protein
MSGTQDMSVSVAGATLDTTRLGGAPRDGDFARLLQAASQPAAHRLHRTMQALPEIVSTPHATREALRAPSDPTVRDRPALIDGLFGQSAQTGTAQGASGGHAMVPTVSRTEVAHADAAMQAGTNALQAGSSMLQRWSRKPPKDRAVSALFFFAAVWIGLAILGQLATQFEDHAGVLILLAIGAFMFFGRRARRAQQTSGSDT